VAKPAPDTFSLDALAAKIAHTSRPSPPRPSSGARGPTRAETASVARVDAGQGVSQSDVAGLSQLLERLWNPNCIAAEGAGVVIPVKFAVGEDGRVVGRITEGGRDGAADEVVATAARRAIDAVHQAEPYGAAYRGKSFTVNFDAKTACANR
jgi:protein TonB